MPPKIDEPFHNRILAIRKLLQFEIANLFMRIQHSGEPALTDWLERLQTCMRVTNMSSGNNDDPSLNGSDPTPRTSSGPPERSSH